MHNTRALALAHLDGTQLGREQSGGFPHATNVAGCGGRDAQSRPRVKLGNGCNDLSWLYPVPSSGTTCALCNVIFYIDNLCLGDVSEGHCTESLCQGFRQTNDGPTAAVWPQNGRNCMFSAVSH